MTLEFADGIVRGDGRDGIGPFTLEGEYRLAEGELRVGWIKTYDGAHSVLYLGHQRGASIVGRWSIPPGFDGAFGLHPGDAPQPPTPR